MSGTRPYSPGFGSHPSLDGGSAMQRQPEPSDGKPKVPDAGNRKYNSSHQSKRARARFRDDRSKKFHHHGANPGRYVKKHHENSINRCDPFGIVKESPVKQYPNKRDKAKHASVGICENGDGHLKSVQQSLNIVKSENITYKNEHGANKNASVAPLIEDIDLIDNNYNVSLIKSYPCNSNNETTEKNIYAKNHQRCDVQSSSKDFHSDHDMKSIETMSVSEDVNIMTDLSEESVESYSDNVEGLYITLKEYSQVESKFQPRLYLPVNPQRGEIAAGTRDGAAHVLRCLKVWYDLPTDVLFHAINLLDRFLTKMKVRLCHISCISVSCMHIAILSHSSRLPPINPEDLVSISQCKCTAGDMRRMSEIIEQKLGAVGDAITSLHWLRLLLKLLRWATVNLLDLPLQFINQFLQESEMVNRLEILLCDVSCCNIRACELALVLLCTQLDSRLSLMQREFNNGNRHNSDHDNLMRIVDFAMELQRICQIGDESFYSSHQAVVRVLDRYNTRQKTPHRQCLVWKLSSRTLKILRPTDKLTSTLPTIQEQQYPSGSIHRDVNSRFRSDSESSDDLNEDTKDWPTSPVVPIIMQ